MVSGIFLVYPYNYEEQCVLALRKADMFNFVTCRYPVNSHAPSMEISFYVLSGGELPMLCGVEIERQALFATYTNGEIMSNIKNALQYGIEADKKDVYLPKSVKENRVGRLSS